MAGLDAKGTTLNKSDGIGGFDPIGNITSLTPPGLSRDTYDVSDHDSPDSWREFIGGMKDGGEVAADVNYRPSVHDVYLADFEAADAIDYQLAFPDGATWDFKAVLTSFEPDAPFDAQLTASLGWKVSGKPTFTAGP